MIDKPKIVSDGIKWAVDHGADIIYINEKSVRLPNLDRAIEYLNVEN